MFLGIQDLLLTPIYLLLIFALALYIRNQTIKEKHLRKYFIPGLLVKIFGAIFLGLVYQFVYYGGDTANYYFDIQYLHQLMYKQPGEALELIFFDNSRQNYQYLAHYGKMLYMFDPPSYFIVRIGAIIAPFAFGTYTVIAIGFAIISFIGVWKLFTTLVKLYPHLHKEFAISTLFLPSVFFWGSGILKDSICLGALGFAFYACHNLFIKKKKIIFSIVIIAISLYVLKVIKIYIALCFIPAALIWAFISYAKNLNSKFSKFVVKPILIIGGIAIATLAATEFSEDDKRYNVDNLGRTAKITSDYLAYVSKKEGGSYYSLGEFDPTLQGMLTKAPQGIWVTLFRPYLWESKNPVMLLSGLESLFFLILTITAVYKTGVRNLIRTVKEHPYLQFALMFSLTFAFAIGISTYNFGTLVRYKIQMMPFYISAVYILLSFCKKKTIRR